MGDPEKFADSDPVEAEHPLEVIARENPVPDLASAVRLAESMRKVEVIADRKERTAAILAGRSIERPRRRAPVELPAHLFQPRAVARR